MPSTPPRFYQLTKRCIYDKIFTQGIERTQKMKIAILDAGTLGDDLDLSAAERFGEVAVYQSSTEGEVRERVSDTDIIIVNKIKMNKITLDGAKKLKLICVAATGFDNIDTEYCKSRGIRVANVPAYSSASVAQVTISMACYLMTHLGEYRDFVHGGDYAKSNSANRLIPVYHEISGLTWGIIGYGSIGSAVGRIAEAFGCRVIVNKRTPSPECECVDLDVLLRESDIISIHCPLNDSSRGMIGERELSLMKRNAVIINAARGAVWDEGAVAEAVLGGRIGGVGCDVYSKEPYESGHPFERLTGLKNVILTPHMAWGSYEARVRCFGVILSNIDAFLNNKEQNLVVK